MNKIDIRKKVDIIITLMTVFFFGLGLTFSMFNFKSSYENYIMFLVLMIVCIVSYYLGITASLVLTLVVDFAYISIKIYQFITAGTLAGVQTYYWIIMIVLAAIVSSALSRNITMLQDELGRLKEKADKLIMVDEKTGIRNYKAFINEVPIYISMVKRHRSLPLTVMVTKIKHKNNIKKILGYDGYKELINLISESSMEILRDEDRKYVLDEDRFAYILITDKKGAEVVRERLKEKIDEIVLEESKLLGGVKIEIQAGFYEWNDEIKTSMDFLEKAESELNYDL